MAKQSLVRVGRVLHQDADFMTLEISKNDQVTFHLQMDADGVTVGGDEFYTLMFVRQSPRGGDRAIPWNPFEGD